jgi:hypothetical protein
MRWWQFCSNGQYILIHTKEKSWYFDMESGKMLYEEEPNDGGLVHVAMNTNMTYDPEHNIFYTFICFLSGFVILTTDQEKIHYENE